MILDAHNRYSNAQALTGTAASTDIVDHGQDRNLGIGEPMCVIIVLNTAADSADGNETYTAALQTDDNAGFASPAQVGATVTIPRGTAAGTRYVIAVPPDTSFERYSRLYYTLGGTTPAVTLTAALIPQSFLQNEIVYPDAFDIT